MSADKIEPPLESSDPNWFREPTAREHRIACGLFTGFGLFFLALFVILAGYVALYLFLGLGIFSIVRGLWHGLRSLQLKKRE